MILFGPILKWATIVPPFIMLFFPGGAGGVFGNATGGVKGAILGGAICGILLAVGQAVLPLCSAPLLPNWRSLLIRTVYLRAYIKTVVQFDITALKKVKIGRVTSILMA